MRIEKREEGGRVTIDFFNKDDLRHLLERIVVESELATVTPQVVAENAIPLTDEEKVMAEDEPRREEDDESLYSISNFSI